MHFHTCPQAPLPTFFIISQFFIIFASMLSFMGQGVPARVSQFEQNYYYCQMKEIKWAQNIIEKDIQTSFIGRKKLIQISWNLVCYWGATVIKIMLAWQQKYGIAINNHFLFTKRLNYNILLAKQYRGNMSKHEKNQEAKCIQQNCGEVNLQMQEQPSPQQVQEQFDSNYNMSSYEEDENQYKEEYQYMEELESYGVEKLPSFTGQYQLQNLMDNIKNQVKEIETYTNFSFDWAISLYHACQWDKALCLEFILDPKQKHKKLIHYKTQFENVQGFSGKGQCGVCGESDVNMFRNICGHQFCYECWKGHLQCRLTNSFKDPFPPCILGQETCVIKMSYTVCELLGKESSIIGKKFIEVLCRSYASTNKFVKVCKGKPGISCNQCFTIKKMYDIIECQNCGNMVCPRCGQKAHGQNQCYQLKNWKEMTQNSLDFMDMLDYKICPKCKQGVNKHTGCNFISCKCGASFCFVCGEKWEPHHKNHFWQPKQCPNYERVKQLQEQKKQIRENKQEFYKKVQARLSKLDIIGKQQQRVDKLKTQQLTKIKTQFLKQFGFYQSQFAPLKGFCSFTQKALCIMWGQTLSYHFEANEKNQFICENIKKNVEKVYDFLFLFMERMYKLVTKGPDLLTQFQKKQLIPCEKLKFQQDFLRKIKEIEFIITKTEQMIESLTIQK